MLLFYLLSLFLILTLLLIFSILSLDLFLRRKKKLFSLKASKLYSISYPKSSPGEIVREFGMDVYTLLYLKWRTNHDLLYSAGTLLNVMWQPGSGVGRFGGEWMCAHVWLSPFYCPPGTTTTLLTDYTPVQNKNFKTDKQVHVVNLSWSKLLRKLNPRKSCMLRPC